MEKERGKKKGRRINPWKETKDGGAAYADQLFGELEEDRPRISSPAPVVQEQETTSINPTVPKAESVPTIPEKPSACTNCLVRTSAGYCRIDGKSLPVRWKCRIKLKDWDEYWMD